MYRYENILLTIIRFGIYGLLFTPLVVSPNTIFPFHFGRGLMIQAIVGVLLGVWLTLIYLFPKYRPQKTLLFVALLVYFGILFISSLFGVDFNRSFWGNEERMGGFFTLSHFFILFLIARSVFKGWKDWKKVFCVSLFVSILICIIALGQREGLINLWGIMEERRTGGTIGNPIFLATYLLFHIFLAFLFAIKSTDWRYKIFFVAIAFLNIFTLFLTETRGALLAFIFSLFLVFIGYLFFAKNKKTRIALIIVLFFSIILSFFIWLNKDSDFIKKTYGLDRIANLSLETLKQGTAKTRLLSWSSSIEAWKEKPILGWGLDNFHIAFSKHYNPELLRHSLYETWFDRAHNVLFDNLVMSGIFGLISYLSIFVVALLMFYKFFRQKIIDKHIFIIITGLFTAYFIQNLVVFDAPTSYLMFFLCLAFIDSFKKYPQIEINKQKKEPIFLIIFLFFLISIILTLFNLQVYRASAQGMKGLKLANTPLEIQVSHFKSALKISTPYKEEIRSDLMSVILANFINKTISDAEIEYYFKDAETVMLENIREHPNHTFYYYILGRLYGEMGIYNPRYFKESEKMFEKAIELSPKRQQIYYGLGRLYLAQKQWEKAINALEIMISLDTETDEPHWFLGVALLTAAGEENNADYLKRGYEEMRMARKLGFAPQTSDDLAIFIEAFLESEEYDYLIALYEDYLSVLKNGDNPRFLDANFCAKIAVIYKERGNKEKAIEATLLAVEFDSSFAKEAEIFLKSLE